MDDQLKQLFDYTKFHIGLYTTLVAGIIGVFANDYLKVLYADVLPFLKVSMVAFVLAGMFGGLVGSTIPFYRTFAHFRRARIGPGSSQLISAMLCTHLEHWVFWVGIVVAAAGLLIVLP